MWDAVRCNNQASDSVTECFIRVLLIVSFVCASQPGAAWFECFVERDDSNASFSTSEKTVRLV